jgi:hypothetical protein
MELEEAVEQLKSLKESIESSIGDAKDLDDIFVQDLEGIKTVLQELDRLQKENEELKEIDLTTVHIKGVCDEKERWRNKIREKIDNRISIVEKLLDEMIDKSIGCINVSLLNKKEKEEVINKRNCLTVQKATLEDIKKDLLKEE